MINTDKIFNTAVVGCGRIGSRFERDPKRQPISTHSGAYSNHPNTKLVAVSDKEEQQLNDCLEDWNVPKGYLNYEEMFEEEDIDFLSVCTGSDTHKEIISRAVDFNVKAILCEKPLADSLESARRIVDLCEENNVFIAINHYRRWDRFFSDLKENLDKGVLGKIQHVNFLYTRGILNSGSHMFDLLRYIFGDIKSIKAVHALNDFDGDLTLSGFLRFQTGLPCFILGLNGNDYRVFDLEIFGTKGKIYIDSSKNLNLKEAARSKRSSGFSELYDMESTVFSSNSSIHIPFLDIISNIIDAITSNTKIKCTGLDGLRSLESIIATNLSWETKRSISLPLENLINLNKN